MTTNELLEMLMSAKDRLDSARDRVALMEASIKATGFDPNDYTKECPGAVIDADIQLDFAEADLEAASRYYEELAQAIDMGRLLSTEMVFNVRLGIIEKAAGRFPIPLVQAEDNEKQSESLDQRDVQILEENLVDLQKGIDQYKEFATENPRVLNGCIQLMLEIENNRESKLTHLKRLMRLVEKASPEVKVASASYADDTVQAMNEYIQKELQEVSRVKSIIAIYTDC